MFKKYCLKVKDCEIVIDVNKITTNPQKQKANELQNKINVPSIACFFVYTSEDNRKS